MVHPCDKTCGNKTESGYCATTACINPQYSNIGTAQYGQGVQKRIVSNADRIRAMTDEELAKYISNRPKCPDKEKYGFDPRSERCDYGFDCDECWIDWIKQEATDETRRNAGRA